MKLPHNSLIPITHFHHFTFSICFSALLICPKSEPDWASAQPDQRFNAETGIFTNSVFLSSLNYSLPNLSLWWVLLFNLMNLGFGSNYYCEALLAAVADTRINFDHASLITLFIIIEIIFYSTVTDRPSWRVTASSVSLSLFSIMEGLDWMHCLMQPLPEKKKKICRNFIGIKIKFSSLTLNLNLVTFSWKEDPVLSKLLLYCLFAWFIYFFSCLGI